jgi:hypothetical protein
MHSHIAHIFAAHHISGKIQLQYSTTTVTEKKSSLYTSFIVKANVGGEEENFMKLNQGLENVLNNFLCLPFSNEFIS